MYILEFLRCLLFCKDRLLMEQDLGNPTPNLYPQTFQVPSLFWGQPCLLKQACGTLEQPVSARHKDIHVKSPTAKFKFYPFICGSLWIRCWHFLGGSVAGRDAIWQPWGFELRSREPSMQATRAKRDQGSTKTVEKWGIKRSSKRYKDLVECEDVTAEDLVILKLCLTGGWPSRPPGQPPVRHNYIYNYPLG